MQSLMTRYLLAAFATLLILSAHPQEGGTSGSLESAHLSGTSHLE